VRVARRYNAWRFRFEDAVARRQQQGSVIVWAIWVFGGVVAAVLLVSNAYEKADVAMKGMFGGSREENVATEPSPVASEPSRAEAELASTPWKAETPTRSSVGIESIAARADGDTHVYEVVWRSPDGGALRFDARRFFLVGFERDGAACAVAVPAASAWSRAADTLRDGAHVSTRRLQTRGASERTEAQALARRLGIADATVTTCDAAAARIEADRRSLGVAHRVRCGEGAFETWAEPDWARLGAAHNRGRNAGVAILTKGLNTPSGPLATMRASVRDGAVCTATNASARARLLGALAN
jgi:hypothetical protein